MKGLEKIRIDELVPEQLRDVAQNLIDFLKVYYSQDVNPTTFIEEITQSRDIDRVANDSFLEQLAQTIAKDVPDSAVVQKTFLLKRLVDYYNLKGTNQSITIFFQLFYDKMATVYEPWTNVLETSSNNIGSNKLARVRPLEGKNLFELEDKEITLENEFGTVLASGYIQRISIEQYEELLYVFHFDSGSTTGLFTPGFNIIYNGNIYGTSVESLQSVNIVDGGSGYERGDILFLKDKPLTTFQAKIISTDIDGRALKFDIIQRGNGSGPNETRFIQNNEPLVYQLRKKDGRVINPTTIGAGVAMDLSLGFSTLIDDTSQGKNNKGLLSDNIVLQDGNYYNKYTYDINVQIPFNEYKTSFENLIHPVGYNVFNNLKLENAPPLEFKERSSLTEISTVGSANFLPGGTNRLYSLLGAKMSDTTPDERINVSPHMGLSRDNYSGYQSPYQAISQTAAGSRSYGPHEYLNVVTGTSDAVLETSGYFMEDFVDQSPTFRNIYVTDSDCPLFNGQYVPADYLSPRVIEALNENQFSTTFGGEVYDAIDVRTDGGHGNKRYYRIAPTNSNYPSVFDTYTSLGTYTYQYWTALADPSTFENGVNYSNAFVRSATTGRWVAVSDSGSGTDYTMTSSTTIEDPEDISMADINVETSGASYFSASRTPAASGKGAYPRFGKINGLPYYIQDTRPAFGIIYNPQSEDTWSSTKHGRWRLSYYSPSGGSANADRIQVGLSVSNSTTNFNQPLNRPPTSIGSSKLAHEEIIKDDSYVVEFR